jgi:phage shock protein A
MSIRLLAIELYRMTREVQRLEKAVETAFGAQREALSRELARARADRDRLRQALDGHKDRPDGAGATMGAKR